MEAQDFDFSKLSDDELLDLLKKETEKARDRRPLQKTPSIPGAKKVDDSISVDLGNIFNKKG